MDIVHLEHELHFPTTFQGESFVLALGFFDGMHLGHQRILCTARAIAALNKCKLAVMTFDPHPEEVLQSRPSPFPYLSSLQARVEAFEKQGVDTLFIVKFTKAFSALSPKAFVDRYMLGLRVIHVVAGFDFTFGYKGAGNMERLRELSLGLFAVTALDKMAHANQKISSTVIRNLLGAGEVRQIPEFLGDYYETRGVIIATVPRIQLSYRKVRIVTEGECLLPKHGVYKVQTKVEERWYDGICLVKAQSGQEAEEKNLDVQLLGCSENLHGKAVKVRWMEYILDKDNREIKRSKDQEGDKYALRKLSL
ncbi:riboflavin kinase [Brevibacillus sp. NRS-1366]|uniref:riboflavin kinase n=1 Tax=Brevibacillus sp. NRS-1366 TaxID=3233899 RepID=UPI003D20AD8C